MLQQAQRIRMIESACQSSSDQAKGMPVPCTKCAIQVSNVLVRICNWKKAASWGKRAGFKSALTAVR